MIYIYNHTAGQWILLIRRTRSQGELDAYVAYSGLNFNTLGKCYLQSKKIVVPYGEEVIDLH